MAMIRVGGQTSLNKRDRPPLPKELPGTFYLLVWDKGRAAFTLHVDDEENSSYDLGSNISLLMMQFKRWGHERMGNLSIDVAKEFGCAQAILADGRVIAIYDKSGFERSCWDKDKIELRPLPKLSQY